MPDFGNVGRTRTAAPPRRSRSWGLIALATLLVLGSGLAVAAWGLHAGDKTSVLEVDNSVPKGHVVERSDLVAVAVSGVAGAVSANQVDDVVGRLAAVDMVAGQILTGDMVTTDPVPGPGQAVVGLSLDPSAVPGAGLDVGDLVDVIAVPVGADGGGASTTETDGGAAMLDAPPVLTTAAEVYATQGRATTGGQVLVTLVVDAGDATTVAAYSTQGRVALIETSPAGSTPQGGADDPSGGTP